MKNKRNLDIILINIICVLALAIVVFPLLLIAKYNYPAADDWSFSLYSYQAIQNGDGIIGAIRGAIESVQHYYFNWDGRFSIAFLGAFQPGIWGEKYYGCVAWIMIGAIIISEMILFKNLLAGKNGKENGLSWLPIILPAIILQILYTPSPEESFYWYNGSVNYTFIHCVSFIVLVLFMKLATTEYSKWKYAVMAIATSLLAILVGGDNFGTSLYCVLTLWILSIIFFFSNKKALKRTWYITVLMTVCLILCIVAPGNANRISSNFGGETGDAVQAVIMSLVRTFTNIYSWTNVKVLLMIFFILPFVWKCVKNMQFNFRLPCLFTLISFGVYASQIAATMYVDGTTGGGRMAAILYYSYCIWIVGNVIYWVGWICKRENKVYNILEQIQSKYGKYLLVYCACIGVIIVSVIYVYDLKELTSYRAYRSWRQGWAQQYAYEWDARLEVLRDPSIKEVVFEPLSVYPEMIMYTDLQDENGHVWVNVTCAEYYDKTSITVKTLQ